MSKVLSCWFWKKKNKEDEYQLPYLKQEDQIVLNSIIYSEPQFKNAMTQQNHQPYRRRTSESLSQNSSNGNSMISMNKNRKIRSYPVSPVRRLHDDRGYLSNKQKRVEMRGDIPYVGGPNMVYVTNMSQNSSLFRTEPQQELQEPFPYEIHEDIAPRRSTLLHGYPGVKYSGNITDSSDSPRYTAEKPIEYLARPGTSRDETFELLPKKEDERHVTIVTPDDTIENSLYFNENQLKTDPVKKTTVVRFRPKSSESFIPGEYVKPMTVRANQVEHQPLIPGRFVHQIPMKPSNIPPVLVTSDGKRLVPVDVNKIRNSVKLERESFQKRSSQIKDYTTVDNTNNFPIPRQEEQVFCAVPIKHAKRTSIDQTRRSSVFQQKRNSISRRESLEMKENMQFPLTQNSEVPMVYAVPVIPTRGRTRSILQQSVKSLTSKSIDEPSIPRKNIRYSVDTDVFAATSRRNSVQRTPQYVNMEKGQAVVVSDVLNPITSLFISDLKDPIPKDPLTKPKESNVWIKPRKQSPQQYTRKASSNRSPPRVRVVYQDSQSKASPVQRRRSRSYDKNRRRVEDSSSSDESFEVYKKKSKQSTNKGVYRQHAVYTAKLPDITLPEPTTARMSSTGKNPAFKKKGKHVTVDERHSEGKDFCALDCESPEGAETSKPITGVANVQTVSSGQQTDVDYNDDDMDLVCYPSEKFIRNTALATESGSKLRWRIIIKRGEAK